MIRYDKWMLGHDVPNQSRVSERQCCRCIHYFISDYCNTIFNISLI